METLLGPFEKAGRIVTPSHKQWKEAGDALAKLLKLRPDLKRKLSALVTDYLLAAAKNTSLLPGYRELNLPRSRTLPSWSLTSNWISEDFSETTT